MFIISKIIFFSDENAIGNSLATHRRPPRWIVSLLLVRPAQGAKVFALWNFQTTFGIQFAIFVAWSIHIFYWRTRKIKKNSRLILWSYQLYKYGYVVSLLGKEKFILTVLWQSICFVYTRCCKNNPLKRENTFHRYLLSTSKKSILSTKRNKKQLFVTFKVVKIL